MKALGRLGFKKKPGSGSKGPKGGSHLPMVREHSDGRKDITVVKLGAKEIPRGTLQNILKLGNVSEKDFKDALR